MRKELVIDELRRVARLIDAESVSRSQFTAHATFAAATVEQTFGSWNDAIRAAGLVPLPQGGTPRAEKWRLERLMNPATGVSGGRITKMVLRNVVAGAQDHALRNAS